MHVSARLIGACLALALAACQAAPDTPAVGDARAAGPAPRDFAPDAPSPAGRYTATGPAPTTLDLTTAPDGEWHIALRGGAVPNGAATAADCELQARGPLSGGRIDAAVVPFEGELISVTEADLADAPARVAVVLDGDTATVETDYAGCGMGAGFDGAYRRTGST